MSEFNRETFEKLIDKVACLQCEVKNLSSGGASFTDTYIPHGAPSGSLTEDINFRLVDTGNSNKRLRVNISDTYPSTNSNAGLEVHSGAYDGYSHMFTVIPAGLANYGYSGAVNHYKWNINGTQSQSIAGTLPALTGGTQLWIDQYRVASGAGVGTQAGTMEVSSNTVRGDGSTSVNFVWSSADVINSSPSASAAKIMFLDGETKAVKFNQYGAVTKDAATLGVTDSGLLAGYATNGTLIEVDKTPFEENLYTADGVMAEDRIVDLRSFDINFRRGALSSETPLMSLDGGGTMVVIGGTAAEGFGTLHIKSQGTGDAQVMIGADTTNAVIMRLLNSGTFRLDKYGQGNKDAATLSKTYTNGTVLAPSDDGTFIEVPSSFIANSVWVTATETASVNDWAPTGFATANVLVRNGAGAISITGLDATGAVQGTERQIHNRGTGVVTLPDFDVLSVITNRFKTPGGAGSTISVDGVATCVYNGTNWYIKSVT